MREGYGGRRVEFEAEFGLEAGRTQHAYRILAKAGPRIADDAQGTLAEILHAPDEVEQFAAREVVIDGIDGEIAALGIFCQSAAEDVVAQQDAAVIGALAFGGPSRGGSVRIGIVAGAEGGDLDQFPADVHMDDPKAAADDARAAKQRTHLFGRGVGGDIEVLDLLAEQGVPDTAADHQRLVPGGGQGGHYLARARADGGRKQLMTTGLDSAEGSGRHGRFPTEQPC